MSATHSRSSSSSSLHLLSCADTEPLNVDHVNIDPKWALKIPATLAMRKQLLPLSELNGTIFVACRNAQDSVARQTVEKLVERPCQLVEAEADSLTRAISRVHQRLTLGEPLITPGHGSHRESPDNAIRICDELFQAAVLRGASDIHLIPSENSLIVHLRVDGLLEQYREINSTLQPQVISRLKVLAGMDIAEKRTAQDGRLTAFCGTEHRRLEIRAASLPTRYGERLTLRLLGGQAADLSLPGLGMGHTDLRLFQHAAAQPHGLVLLTGPTGSGKSTTLYVAIQHLLNTRGGNVITIEDPIEYEISGASQVEVDSADKVNFSKALRSVLRHDPDIVMIGEIRDRETADTAIKAALTGHLVFSTAHTNTAAGVVTRLLDMGVEPFLVAATLRLSVAQRLVRRLCPKCRRARTITAHEAEMLQQPDLAGLVTYESVGCLSCSGKGFSGRIGLFEMLANGPTLAKLIAEQANETVVAEEALLHGSRPLLADGIAKILDGTTTIAEVISAVDCGASHAQL